MADLDTDTRNSLDDSDFAVPATRQLPIHDEAHVKAAMSRFGQTKFTDAGQKSAAAKRIVAKAKKLGIKISDDNPLTKMGEPDPGAIKKHTHAKAGGGTTTHSHDPGDHADNNDAAHAGLLKHPKLSEDAAAVIRLDFAEAVKFDGGEKRVPFLTATHAEFDDYGPFDVTPQDLKTVKRLFDEHARRQDVPALLDIEVFGEVNEEHHEYDAGPGRAVGWVKSLEFAGDDRLDAVVELNTVGDRILANDQYRYVSPELLRNWKDPELGVIYPLVATGLAFTNKPRLKSLGRIAASESAPAVSLLAFSEGPATGNPRAAVRTLLAEDNDPDNDGDDDGPCPPCQYQPPYSAIGCCPGYTRRPGDTDGDGTCVFADKGCNGYIGVNFGSGLTSLPIAAQAYSEGKPMPDEPTPEVQTPAPTPTDPPAEPAAQAEANLSETSAILAAERARTAKLETRVTELSESLARQQTAMKLAETTGKLEELARDGRITPAEVTELSEKVADLSGTSAWVLDMLAKRERVIEFGERGTAKSDAHVSDEQRMDAAVRQHMAERKAQGETVKYRDALLAVSRNGYRG